MSEDFQRRFQGKISKINKEGPASNFLESKTDRPIDKSPVIAKKQFAQLDNINEIEEGQKQYSMNNKKNIQKINPQPVIQSISNQPSYLNNPDLNNSQNANINPQNQQQQYQISDNLKPVNLQKLILNMNTKKKTINGNNQNGGGLSNPQNRAQSLPKSNIKQDIQVLQKIAQYSNQQDLLQRQQQDQQGYLQQNNFHKKTKTLNENALILKTLKTQQIQENEQLNNQVLNLNDEEGTEQYFSPQIPRKKNRETEFRIKNIRQNFSLLPPQQEQALNYSNASNKQVEQLDEFSISRTKKFRKVSQNNNNFQPIIINPNANNNQQQIDINNGYTMSSSPKKKIKSNLVKTPMLQQAQILNNLQSQQSLQENVQKVVINNVGNQNIAPNHNLMHQGSGLSSRFQQYFDQQYQNMNQQNSKLLNQIIVLQQKDQIYSKPGSRRSFLSQQRYMTNVDIQKQDLNGNEFSQDNQQSDNYLKGKYTNINRGRSLREIKNKVNFSLDSLQQQKQQQAQQQQFLQSKPTKPESPRGIIRPSSRTFFQKAGLQLMENSPSKGYAQLLMQ